MHNYVCTPTVYTLIPTSKLQPRIQKSGVRFDLHFRLAVAGACPAQEMACLANYADDQRKTGGYLCAIHCTFAESFIASSREVRPGRVSSLTPQSSSCCERRTRCGFWAYTWRHINSLLVLIRLFFHLRLSYIVILYIRILCLITLILFSVLFVIRVRLMCIYLLIFLILICSPCISIVHLFFFLSCLLLLLNFILHIFEHCFS